MAEAMQDNWHFGRKIPFLKCVSADVLGAAGLEYRKHTLLA